MATLTMAELKSWLQANGFDLQKYPVRIVDDNTIAFTYSGESHFVRVQHEDGPISLWWLDREHTPFTANDLKLISN